eukprot:gene16219-17852_t
MESQRLATKSPIHVHVARNTPVHVHVKKKGKKQKEMPGVPNAIEQRISQRHSSGLGSSVSSGKSITAARSKARSTPTFIPPPGKSSNPGRSISWDGPSHRLEINQPISSSKRKAAIKMSDLSTSEEEDLAGKDAYYESKISSLMDEVGTLRNEVALQKTSRVVEKKNDQLNVSRRLLEEQEDEILGYKSELDSTIRENEKLRHSVEKFKDVVEASRSEFEHIENEKETLLRKLVEVEVDGQAAAEEVGKLRDTVRRLKHDKKLTVSDVSALSHQREILMQKLEGFESTNRALRKMLKHAHNKEEQTDHLVEQRNVLLRKLTEAETNLASVEADFEEKENQVVALMAQVHSDKEQARTFEELQKTMEATRAHLQNQLKNKEGENNRMSVQLRELEQDLNRRIMEVEHLEGLLSSTRDKSMKDKEALKKATRIQRDRASKSEEALEHLKNNLAAKEEEAGSLAIELETFKDRYTKASESLTSRLKSSLLDLKAYKTESESMKEQVASLSDKLRSVEKSAAAKASSSQGEIAKLQTAVQQYETLITEFKLQIERYRKENEELNDKVYQKEKELKKQFHQSANESEKAATRFEKRIAELEPYPELLKTAEIRLHDAQERVIAYEKRASEHTKLIAELTQKVDSQSEQLERVREKYHGKQDDMKQIQLKYEVTERKLEDTELHRREMMNVVEKREDSIRLLQERLDDQRHENSRLVQQLDTALADARRQADVQKEKTLSKERTAQARIIDLEAQLTRSTATAQQLKRAKDESERKFNSRLQDMRDRLEQANTTTRSMQSYVSFLKSTYANVFNEPPDSPLSSPRPY